MGSDGPIKVLKCPISIALVRFEESLDSLELAVNLVGVCHPCVGMSILFRELMQEMDLFSNGVVNLELVTFQTLAEGCGFGFEFCTVGVEKLVNGLEAIVNLVARLRLLRRGLVCNTTACGVFSYVVRFWGLNHQWRGFWAFGVGFFDMLVGHDGPRGFGLREI